MFEKVRDIIVEQLGVSEEEVTKESSLIDDLGADSLDLVELVMAFSDEFGIDIPDDVVAKMVTVSDVVDYLKQNA
jgi:acyl carrier protein